MRGPSIFAAARLRPYESIYSVCHAGLRVLRIKADIIGMTFRSSSRGFDFGAWRTREPLCTMQDMPFFWRIAPASQQMFCRLSAGSGASKVPESGPSCTRLQNLGEFENGDDDAKELDNHYFYIVWNGSADWRRGTWPGGCSSKRAIRQRAKRAGGRCETHSDGCRAKWLCDLHQRHPWQRHSTDSVKLRRRHAGITPDPQSVYWLRNDCLLQPSRPGVCSESGRLRADLPEPSNQDLGQIDRSRDRLRCLEKGWKSQAVRCGWTWFFHGLPRADAAWE